MTIGNANRPSVGICWTNVSSPSMAKGKVHAKTAQSANVWKTEEGKRIVPLLSHTRHNIHRRSWLATHQVDIIVNEVEDAIEGMCLV